MFETGSRRPRRLSPLALSAAFHVAAGAGLLLGPLLVLAEPPEPPARLFALTLSARPAVSTPARVTTAPPGVASLPRAGGSTHLAPLLVSPASIPDTLPAAPDAPPEEPAGGAVGPSVPGGDDQAGPGGPGGGAATGEGGEAPLDLRGAAPQGVVPPEPIETPSPSYPEVMRRAHVQGVVVLEAVIGSDGRILRVTVVRGVNPLLDAAAVSAVSRWTYRPARVGARPVPVLLDVAITFALR